MMQFAEMADDNMIVLSPRKNDNFRFPGKDKESESEPDMGEGDEPMFISKVGSKRKRITDLPPEEEQKVQRDEKRPKVE